MESLLLQFQDFGVRVHAKIGDYLKEFDPALTDTIPASDWIFGDELELHGLELPTNVIKGEEGFHISEPYEQWPTAGDGVWQLHLCGCDLLLWRW
jgi:hypothetical protein